MPTPGCMFDADNMSDRNLMYVLYQAISDWLQDCFNTRHPDIKYIRKQNCHSPQSKNIIHKVIFRTSCACKTANYSSFNQIRLIAKSSAWPWDVL